jgi:hypothetical protein
VNASQPEGPASPDSTVDAPRPQAPATLRWAVRLLYLEAGALAVVTAYLVYQDLTATATSLTVAIALTVFAALAALAVGALARALARRAAGARGPAVVVQLMLLVISYYMVQAGLLWLGVPLILLGLAVGGLLLAPATTRALGLG